MLIGPKNSSTSNIIKQFQFGNEHTIAFITQKMTAPQSGSCYCFAAVSRQSNNKIYSVLSVSLW